MGIDSDYLVLGLVLSSVGILVVQVKYFWAINIVKSISLCTVAVLVGSDDFYCHFENPKIRNYLLSKYCIALHVESSCHHEDIL